MKIFAIAIIMLIAAVWVVRSIRRQKFRQQEYRDAFDSVFSELSAMPKYEQSYSYSYPAFIVTFANESELDESNSRGLTERFTRKIEELCKDSGSRKNPFNAEQAIWFTYEGQTVTSRVIDQ